MEKKALTISLAGLYKVEGKAEAVPPGQVPTGVWVTGAPLHWTAKTPIDGKGVIVGVLDTGIDDSHPDLKGKVVLHRNYISDNDKKSEYNEHGTHVAGIIAADGRIKGVAPKAVLHDYRVLDKQGIGNLDTIARAIRDAIKDGCDIINMSLGGPTDYQPLHESIKAAVLAGVLVVVAAGNDGEMENAPQIDFPAYYDEVVSVGAVDFEESKGQVIRQRFSSRNDQVDVACDGYRVLSTVPGGGYAYLTGTSMASPHVAGFAALLLQKYRVVQSIPRSFPAPVSTIEPILYALLKESTVDILDQGIDWTSGAGFVTAYPTLPKRGRAGWAMPGMEIGAP